MIGLNAELREQADVGLELFEGGDVELREVVPELGVCIGALVGLDAVLEEADREPLARVERDADGMFWIVEYRLEYRYLEG